MSDFIMPTQQWPIPCDFGPFAGGYCGKVVSIDFRQAKTNIQAADIQLELSEYADLNIHLKDLIISNMEIDWTLTTFSTVSEGSIDYDKLLGDLTYHPDSTLFKDRMVEFEYTVVDELGGTGTGKIKIKIIDATPVLNTPNINLSGTENEIFTIDLKQKITIDNSTIDYSLSDTIILSTPTEGTATVSNGIITFTPSKTPTNSRTATFTYTAKDISGLYGMGTVSIALTDLSPVLTTTAITKTIARDGVLNGSVSSNIVIKNDVFESLEITGLNPNDGTLTINGTNYVFTPNINVLEAQTLNLDYKVTTKSGLTSTSKLQIVISYDNPWLKTVWLGNSESLPTQAVIETTFKSFNQTNYLGTYTWTVEQMKYKWFIYPKSYGINPVILDAITAFPIAGMEELFTYITIQGVELVVFKSYNIINGPLSMKIMV